VKNHQIIPPEGTSMIMTAYLEKVERNYRKRLEDVQRKHDHICQLGGDTAELYLYIMELDRALWYILFPDILAPGNGEPPLEAWESVLQFIIHDFLDDGGVRIATKPSEFSASICKIYQEVFGKVPRITHNCLVYDYDNPASVKEVLDFIKEEELKRTTRLRLVRERFARRKKAKSTNLKTPIIQSVA